MVEARTVLGRSVTTRVTVGDTWTTLSQIDALRRTDVYQNAPEPPPNPDWHSIRTNSANLLYLHALLGTDSVWDDPHSRLVEARAYRFIQNLRANQRPGEYEAAFSFKTIPDPYQLDLFAVARHMVNIALAPVALGTGKTKMTLDIAADKFLRNEIDGLIVLAPNGVHRQWINSAIPTHLVDAVRRRAFFWKPSGKVPENILSGARDTGPNRIMRILALNIESLSAESGKAFKAIKKMLASGRMMLVVDESTRIKSSKAQRTKALMKLRHLAAVRVILTGTPITKGLEDFYSQYAFLDPAIIGLSTFLAFRHRYCVTMPAFRGAALGAVKIVGYKNQEELIRKIAPVSFMIGPEVLGLPPQRFERCEVEMTPEQETIYNALARDLYEDLVARRIAHPANAAVRILRLQQVLCGRYYENVVTEDDFETQEPRRIPSNRPAALANMIEQYDGQAVIWARFQEDIDDIVEALAGLGRVATYDGRVSQADREDAVEKFKRGELDYLIANPAAGGTGVDGLQVACAAFYYSRSWNFEHWVQSLGRIYRRGQLNSSLYTIFGVRRTVDDLIDKNLENKEGIGQMVRSLMANPELLNVREETSDGMVRDSA